MRCLRAPASGSSARRAPRQPPANGAVIAEAAAAGQMIQKARYTRRRYRRRAPYYAFRPGPYYTYRPYDPSSATTLHQLSQENQERAQQNVGFGGGHGGGGGHGR